MSALPPKADIAECDWDVRFVPKADILRCGKERRYSITSSAVADLPVGVLERNHITAGYSDPLGGHWWSAARHVPGRVSLAESTF